LKTCNVLKKNEKTVSLRNSNQFETKINLLRSELTSESGVAMVGKIVMASAIVYAVTRMFKSKKVKSKK
jgi:ethanolamine ammonia-lyase large subunit